jgi:hypothetical protein
VIDPNIVNFKKGPAKETRKAATTKEDTIKEQLSRRVLQKSNFQGSFCKRVTMKNDLDNCSFKERL